MTTEALKSANITGLDASPPTKLAAGQGSPAHIKEVSGSVTTTTNKTSGSTYRLVRLPTTACVKHVFLNSGAMSTSTAMDFGVYYADDTSEYTDTNNAGAVVDQDFFASAVDVSSAVKDTEITNESGTYTIDKRIQPLWQAVGLSADPGGFFDIVGTNTATITAGALLGISVNFTSF